MILGIILGYLIIGIIALFIKTITISLKHVAEGDVESYYSTVGEELDSQTEEIEEENKSAKVFAVLGIIYNIVLWPKVVFIDFPEYDKEISEKMKESRNNKED